MHYLYGTNPFWAFALAALVTDGRQYVTMTGVVDSAWPMWSTCSCMNSIVYDNQMAHRKMLSYAL